MEVKGLVLWENQYKETSKLLRVFTDKLGKITILAQGVMRKSGKHRSVTQPFTENRYELQRGKSFYYIREGEVITSYYHLTRSYEKVLYGGMILELLDTVMYSEQPAPEIYELARQSFESMVQGEALPVALAFALRFLREQGYGIQMHECIHCGNRKIRELYLSSEVGGLLCEKCPVPGRIPITKEEYRLIYRLLTLPMEQVAKLSVEDELRGKLFRIMQLFLKANLEIPSLKSYTMIKDYEKNYRK